jgi:hypothetical protein
MKLTEEQIEGNIKTLSPIMSELVKKWERIKNS